MRNDDRLRRALHDNALKPLRVRSSGTQIPMKAKRKSKNIDHFGLRVALLAVLGTGLGFVGLLSLLSSTAATGGAGDLIVYDNAIQSGWVDASYGTTNVKQCSRRHYVSASCAYSARIWGDSAISFGRSSGTISTGAFRSLDWYVYLHGWPISAFRTYLEDAYGNHINDVYLSSANITGRTANGFVRVSVPMATLNPANTPVAAFRLLKNNRTNWTTPRIWVDDVRFVAANPSSTPAPSPSPSPSASSTPVVTPAPTPTPTSTPDPTPNPSPVASSTPVVTPTPSPSPTSTPTATPSPTPVASSTPVVTPTPLPSPTSTPTPTPSSNWKAVNIGDPSEDWSTGPNEWNWTAIGGDLNDIQSAGIGYVRMDLEYTTPLSFYDQLFPAIASRGITPIVIVHKNPPSDDLGDATSRAMFKSWLNGIVTRYGQYTKLWEIGNEPNLGGSFWNTPDAPSTGGDQAAYDAAAQNYVAHLQDAYTTIKSVQSDSIVLCGGISEWTMEDWVTDLIKFDAAPYMDAVAFHPYSNDGPNGVIRRLDDFRAAIGADPNGLGRKPIYITEVGFNTAGWNPGDVPDEITKATYLQQMMTGLRADGITTPIVWYDLHEGRSATAGFGLVSKDPSTLKTIYLPAYSAYRDLK